MPNSPTTWPDDATQKPSPAAPVPDNLNSVASNGAGMAKELEPRVSPDVSAAKELMTDIELEPDVEQAGVTTTSETIEIPPDLKKIGVQAIGSAQSKIQSTIVKLPLTDEQIITGLHSQIITSLRWLSEWCVKKLKTAHVHLRVITGGKIVRESD